MAPPSPHQVLVIKTKTTDDSGAKRESDSTFTFEKKIQSLLSSSPLLLQILPGVEKILNVPAQTVLRPHDPIKACRGRVTQGLVIKKRGRSKLGHPTDLNDKTNVTPFLTAFSINISWVGNLTQIRYKYLCMPNHISCWQKIKHGNVHS